MQRNILLTCGLLIFALVAAAAPAWGQRIRFAQTPPTTQAATDELADDQEEPEVEARVASRTPLKPSWSPKSETRPAAPEAHAPEVTEERVVASPRAAVRIGSSPPAEYIETPPPYFIEPQHDYPPMGYDPYWGAESESFYGPSQPSFWAPGVLGNWCGQVLAQSRGTRVFGEFLFLRPRDTEVAVAVPGQAPVIMAGVPTVAVPQGETLILDPDHSAGVRVGVALPVQDCITVQLAYAKLESETQNSRQLTAAELNQNMALFPLLIHPRTALPNNLTNVAASGHLDVDFEIVDLDTRLILLEGHGYNLTGYAGSRWATLDQNLTASYSINGGTIVETGSQYEGLGPRLGLEGYGPIGCWGFGYYARSDVSFLYGVSRGDFRQYQQNNAANPQIFNKWEADRVAPVYELEMGFQWMGPRKHLRLSAGYMMSVWFNTITTEEVVQGLQDNQFDDLSDTMTFDGFTARVEFRL